MPVIITRAVNGISINGNNEYVMDDEQNVMKFSTAQDALNFLEAHGITNLEDHLISVKKISDEDYEELNNGIFVHRDGNEFLIYHKPTLPRL